MPDDEIEDHASRDSIRTINGPGCDTQVNDTSGALYNDDRAESPALIRNGSPSPDNVNDPELPSLAQRPESSSSMERTGSPSLLSKCYSIVIIYLSLISTYFSISRLSVLHMFQFEVKVTFYVHNVHSINNR